MPKANNYIINLGLKIHQNSCAEQKYFNIKLKEKIEFYGIIINLFQVYDDSLQMAKEKILLCIWISFRCVYIACSLA